MLRIIIGQPGSGKTYYAVNYLAKFCEYDKVYNQYILQSDTLLITNIDDIKVQHMHVDTFFNQKMYRVEYLKKYMESKGYKRVVMIIDECQKYLSKEALKEYKEHENEIYFFFEYHRHIGCDIFLITQSVSSLPKRIVNLSEYIISARPRSVLLPKVFIYDCQDTITGDRLFVVRLQKSDTVFRLYKSFDFQEVEKPKNFLIRKWALGIALVVLPLVVAIFIVSSGKLFGVAKNKTQQNQQVVYSSQNPIPQTPSNSLSQNVQIPSNSLGQNVQTPSNSLSDVCIFASCEYPKLRRYYAKNDKEHIAGKVCYANSCYYYVQKYEEENEHVFARSEKGERSSEQSDKKESLAVVPRERHEGKETTERSEGVRGSGVF